MKQCMECNKPFPETELNHWDTCESCADILEALADIRSRYSAKKIAALPHNVSYGYEWEITKPPDWEDINVFKWSKGEA